MEGRIPGCQGNFVSNSRNKGANIRIPLTRPRGNARPSTPPLHKSSVLKSVLRKYETGETCEIGEIFRCMFSITYVIFNRLGSRGRERVLPEEPINQITYRLFIDLKTPHNPTDHRLRPVWFCRMTRCSHSWAGAQSNHRQDEVGTLSIL